MVLHPLYYFKDYLTTQHHTSRREVLMVTWLLMPDGTCRREPSTDDYSDLHEVEADLGLYSTPESGDQE